MTPTVRSYRCFWSMVIIAAVATRLGMRGRSMSVFAAAGICSLRLRELSSRLLQALSWRGRNTSTS